MRGAARHTDPDTALDAADSIETTRREEAVLTALKESAYGLTTLQIAERLNLPPWSVSPRIRPLRRKGLVRDSLVRAVGPSGRKLTVWEAVSGKYEKPQPWELRLLADVT
jgi:hypothetical protein